MLSSWLHLLALTAYLGSITGLWIVLLPTLSAVKNHEDRVHLLARSLKIYNPLQTGSLGMLVLSGAFQLTHLKAAYRELLVKELGARLGWKLALSFVLVILSTYQVMGVAHRFVRQYERGESLSIQDLQSAVHGLRVSSLILIFLTLITALVGAWMRG